MYKVGNFTIEQESDGKWYVSDGDLDNDFIVFNSYMRAYMWANLYYNCATLVSQGVANYLEMVIKEEKL